MVVHKNQFQKDREFKYEKLNFKAFRKKILETTFVTWGEEEFLKEDTESINHKEQIGIRPQQNFKLVHQKKPKTK